MEESRMVCGRDGLLLVQVTDADGAARLRLIDARCDPPNTLTLTAADWAWLRQLAAVVAFPAMADA